jgi:glycerol-3-phosphate dehydrogenase
MTIMSDAVLYDLVVVGGGINGTGIARDAAGRGLKVLLVEQNDLASATSSASSKLVHGGLRYLEQYEFRLVREALAEREVLLRLAPHLVRPLTFVLPHDPALRPAWMIRAGLFLYDHLARRSRLPASRSVDLSRHSAGRVLNPSVKRAFSYSDCQVDDSRLVVVNAIDAKERGATIRTRCRFVRAAAEGGSWTVTVQPRAGRAEMVRARILVNAAGPWVENVLEEGLGRSGPRRMRLVKGSHIVVPRLYGGDEAFILQNADGRIVFLIPFEADFTLIGTTDEFFAADPAEVAIAPEETRYLCGAANRFLREPVQPGDVVWSYAGVRPLYDDAAADPSTMTRDYAFDLGAEGGRPPLLSVFGGKLTTYRRLAEHALAKLQPFLPAAAGPPWTARAPLPGGAMPGGDFDAFLTRVRRDWPWLPADLARRLAHAYGVRIERLLVGAARLQDLGRDLGAGLTEREIEYLLKEEWAEAAEDILWRRGKLGLRGGEALTRSLSDWLARAGASTVLG